MTKSLSIFVVDHLFLVAFVFLFLLTMAAVKAIDMTRVMAVSETGNSEIVVLVLVAVTEIWSWIMGRLG